MHLYIGVGTLTWFRSRRPEQCQFKSKKTSFFKSTWLLNNTHVFPDGFKTKFITHVTNFFHAKWLNNGTHKWDTPVNCIKCQRRRKSTFPRQIRRKMQHNYHENVIDYRQNIDPTSPPGTSELFNKMYWLISEYRRFISLI